MTTEIVQGPQGELRAASTAGGGTALTTAAAFIQLPDGTNHIWVSPRNLTTAVVAKILVNPYLVVFKTTDNLVAAANASYYSIFAQDAQDTTLVNLDQFDLVGGNDFFYVGTYLPFSGLRALISSANAIASVMTVRFWNGTAWTAVSGYTDGTIAAGATLAADGSIVWTVPTTWVQATLGAIQKVLGLPWDKTIKHMSDSLYWVRIEVSAKLSVSTALKALLSINRSTAYFELVAGQIFEERIRKTFGGIGCIQAATDAGTANLIVNVASQYGDNARILP